MKNLEQWGCQSKLIVKTDQEPAVRAVVEEVKKQRQSETLVEAAKKYDSQSNGDAEKAVQDVEGQARTLKLHLENRIMRTLPPGHPVVHWLVEYAAEVITQVSQGEWRRTA